MVRYNFHGVKITPSRPGFVLWTTTRHRALTSYGGQVGGQAETTD